MRMSNSCGKAPAAIRRLLADVRRFSNPRLILHRASACCCASVFHPYRWDDEDLDRALLLRCRACKQACKFVLVDERGRVVWSEPEIEP